MQGGKHRNNNKTENTEKCAGKSAIVYETRRGTAAVKYWKIPEVRGNTTIAPARRKIGTRLVSALAAA